MTSGTYMPVPAELPETTYTPTVGARVVLIYPPDWGLDNRYGIVHKLNPDGTYYLIDSKSEQTILVDPRRNLEHGAVVRPILGKEKFPTNRKKKKVTKKKG